MTTTYAFRTHLFIAPLSALTGRRISDWSAPTLQREHVQEVVACPGDPNSNPIRELHVLYPPPAGNWYRTATWVGLRLEEGQALLAQVEGGRDGGGNAIAVLASGPLQVTDVTWGGPQDLCRVTVMITAPAGAEEEP